MDRTDYRLQIVITAGELEAIETFRFEERLPNRTAAVRELPRLGLEAQNASKTNK